VRGRRHKFGRTVRIPFDAAPVQIKLRQLVLGSRQPALLASWYQYAACT